MIGLFDYQLDAIKRMSNGCILNGGVGSGKSRTALGYYYQLNGGDLYSENYTYMNNPQDLYIITTAKKRDSKKDDMTEWEADMLPYFISENPERNYYKNKVVVDSWNNISKYTDIQGAFFIFDEQRLVGKGAWVKAFYKIARYNSWILLTGTPGDQWADYIPVFIANGFYRNRTEFQREHIVWSPYTKFPTIQRYLNTGRLIRLRDKILVDMDFVRTTVPHHEDVYCTYDILKYKEVCKTRWNKDLDKPIESASELCYLLRKVVNEGPDRQLKLLEIFEDHPRLIIFYNFDYELEILHKIFDSLGIDIAEWNGHKHQELPRSSSWVYFVQYTSGCEGWNCITTDTIVFFSQNYSYKVVKQACGRIDRLNTPYKDLYYYHLKSRSGIDLAISKALANKKKFNEGHYVNKFIK